MCTQMYQFSGENENRYTSLIFGNKTGIRQWMRLDTVDFTKFSNNRSFSLLNEKKKKSIRNKIVSYINKKKRTHPILLDLKIKIRR